MTNPETASVGEVEAFLLAADGIWSILVPSLRASILNNTNGEQAFSDEAKNAARSAREREYDRVLREFTKEYLRRRG